MTQDKESVVEIGPNNRVKVGHVFAAVGALAPFLAMLVIYMGSVRSDISSLVAELQSTRETQRTDAAELRRQQEVSAERMEKQLSDINASIKDLDTNKVRLEPFLLWVDHLRQKYPDTPLFIGR